MLRAARQEAQRSAADPPPQGFNFGLNVWAKMEECRPWPGRVIRKRKPTVQHRDHVAVMFYGEEDEFAWIKQDHIVALTMHNLQEFCRDCPDEQGGFALSVRQAYVDFCHGCPLPDCDLCFYERHAAMEHVRLEHPGLECTADDYYLAAVRRRADLEIVVRAEFTKPIKSFLVLDKDKSRHMFPKLDPKTRAWFEAILLYAFPVPDNEQLPPPDQSTYSTSEDEDDSKSKSSRKKKPTRPDNGGQPREKLRPKCQQPDCSSTFATHEFLYVHLREKHKLGTPEDKLVVPASLHPDVPEPDAAPEPTLLNKTSPDKPRHGASRMADSLAFFQSYDIKPRSPPASSFVRLPKVSEIPADVAKYQADGKPKPAMRIGSDYQAEVPPMPSKDIRGDIITTAPASMRAPGGGKLRYGEEPAVWQPAEELEQLENFEDCMEFAKLRGIKARGGEKWKNSDMEYMYHTLYKHFSDPKKDPRPIITRGLLNFTDPKRPSAAPCLKSFHYEGADSWTPEEVQAFKTGYDEYGKQFRAIQGLVKTKTQAQCIEFFYREFKLDPEYTQMKQALKRRQQEEEEHNQAYGVVVECDRCGADQHQTPRWRIGPNQEDWCDACFVYWREHKKLRPLPTRKPTTSEKAGGKRKRKTPPGASGRSSASGGGSSLGTGAKSSKSGSGKTAANAVKSGNASAKVKPHAGTSAKSKAGAAKSGKAGAGAKSGGGASGKPGAAATSKSRAKPAGTKSASSAKGSSAAAKGGKGAPATARGNGSKTTKADVDAATTLASVAASLQATTSKPEAATAGPGSSPGKQATSRPQSASATAVAAAGLHRCEICHKTFQQPNSLYGHMRVHADPKGRASKSEKKASLASESHQASAAGNQEDSGSNQTKTTAIATNATNKAATELEGKEITGNGSVTTEKAADDDAAPIEEATAIQPMDTADEPAETA
eukprot:m.488746 g.488746  ORF g.488746 m.488746 type:complete len:941 (+) comp26042_c0_seq1:477-3299(+)